MLLEEQMPIIDEATEFHKLIVKSSKNPFLEYMMKSILELIKISTRVVYSVPQRPYISLEEHKKIYQAIAARDGNKATELMVKHLENVDIYLNKYKEMSKRTIKAGMKFRQKK